MSSPIHTYISLCHFTNLNHIIGNVNLFDTENSLVAGKEYIFIPVLEISKRREPETWPRPVQKRTLVPSTTAACLRCIPYGKTVSDPEALQGASLVFSCL